MFLNLLFVNTSFYVFQMPLFLTFLKTSLKIVERHAIKQFAGNHQTSAAIPTKPSCSEWNKSMT